jgi:hypothetical protein
MICILNDVQNDVHIIKVTNYEPPMICIAVIV